MIYVASINSNNTVHEILRAMDVLGYTLDNTSYQFLFTWIFVKTNFNFQKYSFRNMIFVIFSLDVPYTRLSFFKFHFRIDTFQVYYLQDTEESNYTKKHRVIHIKCKLL